MMMFSKFIVTFLFFFVFNTVNGYDQTVECSETNTPVFILENNKLTLFQTPKFPGNIQNNTIFLPCSANFTANNPTDNIWILMLNGVISEMQFYDTHNKTNELTKQRYYSDFDIVNFATSGNGLAVKAFSYESETAWAAFQAIVISYPQSFQGCPLENKTFDFSTDKTSVIPVTPTFQLPDLELSYKLCNWFFTISPDQQLKVVLRKIEFSENDNITVILSNEKGQIHSFNYSDIDQVFYFDGQNFKIQYEFDYANFSNTGFLIFVSAVTKSISYTSNGCKTPYVNMTTKITTYSNIDYINGYPPYQKCESALTIPAGHEARLSITEYAYEGISDKLTIDYGQSSSTLITWTSDKQPISYKLTSDVNGGQFTFHSDGNIRGAGYRADLEVYKCECSDENFVFSCDYYSYLRPMNGYFPYCSNMDCIYTLTANSTCPDFYFNIKVGNYLRKSIDYLIITDNQKIIENVTAESGNSENYFSPNSNVTIHFHSGSSNPISEGDESWYIQIRPMATPTFTKITLNETNTKYVKWLADMKENDALEVCTSTGTLEIFIPQLVYFFDLREFYLYDSNDLNNFVGSLNSIVETAASIDTFPLSLKSTSKCFTLYLQDDIFFGKDYTIFFKNDDDSNKNCADSKTVFQIPPPSMPDMNVTIESTNSGSCEMIILTSDYNSTLLSRIWISDISVSDNEGHYSVNSAENGKELFSFKGSEAAKWINFGVYTPALSITAPPSASITISMSGNFQALEIINIPPNSIQNGIMASPSYSGFKQTFNTQMFYKSSCSTKFSTVFKVKEINGSAKPILENAGKNITLTKGTFTITNSFNLYYEEKDPTANSFMIEYVINSGDVPVDTSTETPIMSSSSTETGTFSTSLLETTVQTTHKQPNEHSTSSETESTKNPTTVTEANPVPTTHKKPNEHSSSFEPTSVSDETMKTSKATHTTDTTLSPASKTTAEEITETLITTVSIQTKSTEESSTLTSTAVTEIVSTPISSTTTTTHTKNSMSTTLSDSKTTTTPIAATSKPTVSLPTSTNNMSTNSPTTISATNPTSISSTNQDYVSETTYAISTTPSKTSPSTTTSQNSAKTFAFEFSMIFMPTLFFVLFH